MGLSIEPLRDALSTRPFQPSKHGRTAVVVLPDGGFKAIDLNLVTALQIDNGRSETTE